MSLFAYPRNFCSPSDSSFTPLFRFLDDFETYTREAQGSGAAQANSRRGGHRHHLRTFNPKFDVRETETAYELHGELPGVERDNIQIEFTDPQTVVVRGRVERSYTAGTPPAGLVEGSAPAGAITENGEQQQQSEDSTATATNSHKATVEDDTDAEYESVQTPRTEAAEPAKNEQAVEKAKPEEQQPKQTTPAEKFWVQERSVGEFSRAFSLPVRVDQDGVTASLNNGILTVVVPKAKKHESRRIAVN